MQAIIFPDALIRLVLSLDSQKFGPVLTRDNAAPAVAAQCRKLHLGQGAATLGVPDFQLPGFLTLKQRLGIGFQRIGLKAVG